jgi:DNA-binding NarL/FixJ family response regulator
MPLKAGDEQPVSFFNIGDEEFAVIAVAVQAAPAERLSTLSAAETSVLADLITGRSNQEIADARGTSVRTVVNQVSAVFRKLGVGSRAELALVLAGGGVRSRS